MKLLTIVTLTALMATTANGFCTSATTRLTFSRVTTQQQQQQLGVRRKDETSDEYFVRLKEAAKDPVKFERFAMGLDDDVVEPVVVDDDDDDKPKKGYQRIEEWDAQRTKDDMSWEERVQYEGQQNGNQFQQNEILRKSLKF